MKSGVGRAKRGPAIAGTGVPTRGHGASRAVAHPAASSLQGGTTINVGALRRRVADLLRSKSDTAHLDARFLVAHALGCSAHDLALLDEKPVDPDLVEEVIALAGRRLTGEPVGRIIGEREFWGQPFRLGPATLEPRPDTETIVSAALPALRDRRDQALAVLDLGTGSGAILLALLSELPMARGIGVDIAGGAAEMARVNAERLRLADRASFVVGDWASAIAGRFDVVVANPPYIPSREIDSLPVAVSGFDPHIALDGGADGLSAYRVIFADLERIVKRDGYVFVEVGAGQLDTVAELAANHGFATNGHYDLAGIGRVLEAVPE